MMDLGPAQKALVDAKAAISSALASIDLLPYNHMAVSCEFVEPDPFMFEGDALEIPGDDEWMLLPMCVLAQGCSEDSELSCLQALSFMKLRIWAMASRASSRTNSVGSDRFLNPKPNGF